MPELIAHLCGDYVLQSHTMALRKTTDIRWALIHALVYGIPFLFLVTHFWQWLFIVGTHALIDRYGIARRWCQWYGVGFPGLWWKPKNCVCGRRLDEHNLSEIDTGVCKNPKPEEFPAPPPFLGVWLVIIVDNTLHLFINHLALLAGMVWT